VFKTDMDLLNIKNKISFKDKGTLGLHKNADANASKKTRIVSLV
jgi:hypothetical protein